jgi:hypothetical protein
VLRKSYDWYFENAQNKYRILWPKWSESIDGMTGDETEDTAAEESTLKSNNKSQEENSEKKPRKTT